jgi:hypothetical protein
MFPIIGSYLTFLGLLTHNGYDYKEAYRSGPGVEVKEFQHRDTKHIILVRVDIKKRVQVSDLPGVTHEPRELPDQRPFSKPRSHRRSFHKKKDKGQAAKAGPSRGTSPERKSRTMATNSPIRNPNFENTEQGFQP